MCLTALYVLSTRVRDGKKLFVLGMADTSKPIHEQADHLRKLTHEKALRVWDASYDQHTGLWNGAQARELGDMLASESRANPRAKRPRAAPTATKPEKTPPARKRPAKANEVGNQTVVLDTSDDPAPPSPAQRPKRKERMSTGEALAYDLRQRKHRGEREPDSD